MGYSLDIRGVFTGYSYVSVMYRLCLGYVSVIYRNRLGGWGGGFNKSLSAQCVVLGAIVVESMLLEHILGHLLRSLKMGIIAEKFAYLQKKQ